MYSKKSEILFLVGHTELQKIAQGGNFLVVVKAVMA